MAERPGVVGTYHALDRKGTQVAQATLIRKRGGWWAVAYYGAGSVYHRNFRRELDACFAALTHVEGKRPLRGTLLVNTVQPW